MPKLPVENKNDKEAVNDDWDEEAWRNWIGFWNLLLQCDMKQNPHLYKKLAEKQKKSNKKMGNKNIHS